LRPHERTLSSPQNAGGAPRPGSSISRFEPVEKNDVTPKKAAYSRGGMQKGHGHKLLQAGIASATQKSEKVMRLHNTL
jgi:hypothetical protein